MRIALPLAIMFALVAPALADDAASLTDPLPPKDISFPFQGPFGMYDREQLQRGFQVYKEVCSACHSMNRVTYSDLDGIGFDTAQIKALAAAAKVPADPNDKGETYDSNGQRLTRPGIPADPLPAPFANEKAARANNNGALPPDLSIIIKAREGGPNYVYSILTGFGQKPPAGFHVLANKYYNPYFQGRNISMPPPLTDGAVTYSDGTRASVDQEAKDVVTFLTWTSEPHAEERKRMGFEVMIFLVILAGLLYLSYRRVWRDMH
jgi:ubiquinol-cytochrome c reductase cytochrome c1 subunit